MILNVPLSISPCHRNACTGNSHDAFLPYPLPQARNLHIDLPEERGGLVPLLYHANLVAEEGQEPAALLQELLVANLRGDSGRGLAVLHRSFRVLCSKKGREQELGSALQGCPALLDVARLQKLQRPLSKASRLVDLGKLHDSLHLHLRHLHPFALLVRAQHVRKGGSPVPDAQVEPSKQEQALQALPPQSRLEGDLEGHVKRLLRSPVLSGFHERQAFAHLGLDEDIHVKDVVGRAQERHLRRDLRPLAAFPHVHKLVEFNHELRILHMLALQVIPGSISLPSFPALVVLERLSGSIETLLVESVQRQQDDRGISAIFRKHLPGEAHGILPAAFHLPSRHLQQLQGGAQILNKAFH
mmetsp:Transcript_15363/g.29636  ORF Transcript_15363/g.29636 Transcript_15363/m.29636 type:complete len:357 (-) Transcript_15363:432-1502(-)